MGSIKFKNQYFNREDYLTFSTENASLDTEAMRAARTSVQHKLHQLQESLKDNGLGLALTLNHNVVSSVELTDHSYKKICSMWISYGKGEGESSVKFITLQAGISPLNFSVRLHVDLQKTSQKERESFNHHTQDDTYRSLFFAILSRLEKGYAIEVGGFRRSTESFQKEQALWEFIRSDYGMHSGFIIERNFTPGDPAISSENIVSVVVNEFAKLLPVYQHLQGQNRRDVISN